jgi:hypothetical protein
MPVAELLLYRLAEVPRVSSDPAAGDRRRFRECVVGVSVGGLGSEQAQRAACRAG